MKIIKLFSGLEFLVENDEAENVARNYKAKTLLRLKSGDYIASSGIEAITEVEIVPYWNGYPLSKDCKSFMRDGQRIYLESESFNEIEYRPHPKYEAIKKALMDKMKMLPDNQRAEASEETAKEERKQNAQMAGDDVSEEARLNGLKKFRGMKDKIFKK